MNEEKKYEESVLEVYGEDLVNKTYITNPAIARDEEIKKLILILLTPEKSGILVGKAGIGKTAVVEGLAYLIQKGEVPDKLKNFTVIKLNTMALVGGSGLKGEIAKRLRDLVEELKQKENIVLFIDEIHTLIGSAIDGSLDIANMLKPGLDRGSIKMIGATTTDEYERYLVRDRAFLRRFEKVELEEPNKEVTLKIVMGTIPKIENKTGARFKYSNFIVENIVKFLVEITSEYKRVFEIASRYPDITLALLSKAFSYAIYDNEQLVTLKHVYKAFVNANNIYPDVIEKERINFKEKFREIIAEENLNLDEG